MSERCSGSVRCNIEDLQEALSIHTRKITDSCRDKDCIEDLHYRNEGCAVRKDAYQAFPLL